MEKIDPKLGKIVSFLEEEGLNGLMIYSSGTSCILSANYFHYFSHCRAMGKRNAIVISARGETVALVEPSWDDERVSRRSWIPKVIGSRDFLGDLIRVCTELGIRSPVGVAGSSEMVEEVRSEIDRFFEVRPAEHIIEKMATEKTEREIENIRRAARIADAGADAFVERSREGIREYELAAELEFAMRSAGADDIFILLSSGSHNREMHEPTDRRLRKGDIIIGEITPVCDGQFVQLCRTVVLGKADDVVIEKYQMLIKAMEESFKQMRPGIPASVITTTMNRVIGDAGYARYCQPPYMRSRGHGFGVGSVLPGPEITPDLEVKLEAGQVIAVHPNQYLPETGYLACGETVMVTESGIQRLSKTETRLYAKEG